MPVEPEFSTIAEADAAYYGHSGGGGGGDDGGSGGDDNGSDDGPGNDNWGTLQDERPLGSEWLLAYQEATDGDRRRWFVIRENAGSLEAINSQGNVHTATANETLGELPHYSSESDAVAAYEKWAAQNGQDEADEEDWGGWQRVRQIDPWWLWTRVHTDGENVQFLLASTRDGEAVYLDANGQVVTSPVLFESVDTVSAALDAYFQRVEGGELPPEEQPDGDSPSRETITEAVRESTHTSQTSSQSELVEKLSGEKVMLAAVGVAGLAVLAGRMRNE